MSEHLLAWRNRLSVRVRLTIAAAAVISVGMAIAAALLLWRVYSVLMNDLDSILIQQIHSAAEDIAGGGIPHLPRAAGATTALQVIGPTGQVMTSVGDVEGTDRMFFNTPGNGEPTLSTVSGPSLEGSYRVAAMTVMTPNGLVTLYLGSPTAPLMMIKHELGTSLAVGIPAAVLVLTSVSWWLTGRALRPVETMRRQAAGIPGHELGQRLDVPTAGDELRRLAETFNDLLDRIASASERQRRFIDDAAHELRSPLASLRTQLEISERTPPAPPGSVSAAPSPPTTVLPEVNRLVDLVNDLLVIARLDSGPQPRHRPVDLDDVVWQCTADAQRQGPPFIDTTGIAPVRVSGDSAGLRRVVQNLLENACRHARSRLVVRLTLEADVAIGGSGVPGPAARLSVSDDGPGIPQADRGRIFDRFVRLDAGRARDEGGTGLGLAIVSSIVAAHGGQVWIEDGGGGTTFVVRLPAMAADD